MTRIKRALEALRGRPLKGNPVIASTVRPSEAHAGYGRRQPYSYREFVELGGLKWSAIAIDRNANAVAQTPYRVMRRAQGKKLAGGWRTKGLDARARYALRPMLDTISTKALGDSEELEEITDPLHPLVRLMTKPNAFQSGFDLTYERAMWLNVTGNSYVAHVPGPKSAVYELWTLPSQHTRIEPSRETFIAAYIYGRGTEIEQRFDPSTVTHVKYANGADPYYGRGPVAGYVGDAQLSVAFTDINIAMMDNGASPSLIIEAEDADAAQAAEIEEKIRQRWSGIRNAFGAFVLRGKMKVAANTSRFPTEMPFMLSDNAVADIIANSHGMSPALLRMDSAALATAQAAMPHWQRMAIAPCCKRISEADNRTFVEEFRRELSDPSLCLVFDDPVTKDQAAEIDAVVKLRGAGGDGKPTITLNEGRGRLGYEPVDGGDEIETAVPLAPEGEDDEDLEDPKERESEAKDGSEDKPEPKVKAVARVKSLADHWFDGTCCKIEHRPRVVKKFNEKYIEKTERELEEMFGRYFSAAIEPIVDGIDSDGRATVQLAQMADFNARARAQVEPVFRDLYLNGYNTEGEFLNARRAGTLDTMSELTQSAVDYLDKYLDHLFDTLGEAVDDRTRRALARTLIEGGDPDDMAGAVEDVLQSASTYGAERIARTETARAWGSARMQAWVDSGVVVGREWLLSGDPCPACEALYAERPVVRIGEPFARVGDTFEDFTVGFMDVYTEPLHPNCRCYAAAIFEDDPKAPSLRGRTRRGRTR